jgi:hypothetical protein
MNGLKLSGRRWNETITERLKENDFTYLISEPCIFKKVKNDKISYSIGLYVDDMIITGKDYDIKRNHKND